MERNYYTVADAAEMLGVSRQTAARYLKIGLVKAHRFGNRGFWRINKESLEAFARGEPDPTLAPSVSDEPDPTTEN